MFTDVHVDMFTCSHVYMLTCLHIYIFSYLHIYTDAAERQGALGGGAGTSAVAPLWASRVELMITIMVIMLSIQ